MTQEERLREAKIRTYQTCLVFAGPSFERSGLRLLTFLGFAIPILGGGIIFSFYATEKPPAWVAAIFGFLAVLQLLASLWSVVYGWEETAWAKEGEAKKWTGLRIELDQFRPGPDGSFDELLLQKYERQAAEALYSDNVHNIPQRTRDGARAQAEKRFPPPPPPAPPPSAAPGQ